jgi:hypothetical protein
MEAVEAKCGGCELVPVVPVGLAWRWGKEQQVQATQSYPLITRLLLWAGAVGPLLFVVVLLIEGATRPGYSA